MKKWVGLLCLMAVCGAQAERPNIIFMLADDLGYGDLSCYNPNSEGKAPNNTPIRTPALDRMARNGVRLTDFHSAAPICSPSRRALLSARYTSRLGEWAEAYRGSPDGMVAAREPTIGMWLKRAGYATACYGKWNVGEVKDVSWPGAHGFDDWLIIDHNTGYFQHQNANKDCQGREMLFGTGGVRVTNLRGKYLTDIWTDKALEFIDTNADKPFFLYLPFAVPHSPLQDPADPTLAFDEQPERKTPEGRQAFVKMVEYLDSRIGKIMQALAERGLTDNTLIMFTSDNGGMLCANNWPLKQGKQWLEEGGIRVPCLMQWPGVIPPGAVSTQPSVMMDASVTMLAAGDAMQHVPQDRKLDGMDLLPILQGKSEPVRDRVLGWRRRDWSPNFNSLRQEAYRVGDWKLLRTYKHAKGNQRSAEHSDELFNLADDMSEADDLAQTNPEKLAAMQAAFIRWQKEVVEQKPDYLIPVPDQLGSPAKYPPVSMLFDFKRDRLDGKLLTRNNETRISEPVIRDGVFKTRLSPGLVHPTPILYREGAMATDAFSTIRVRMKVTVEDGGDFGPARALLRQDEWKGKDIPFKVRADGKWHEYVIDVTQSPAWRQWTPRGRIGMVMPEPDKSPVTVEIDFIKLEDKAER
jgi:arylsulfatase A